MVIGHQKGRDTKQKIHRNFGMPRPEGYRKAQRLMEMAERFKMPVVWSSASRKRKVVTSTCVPFSAGSAPMVDEDPNRCNR